MPQPKDSGDIAGSWSILYAARRQLLKRYPTVWDIPIRKKHTDVIADELSSGMKVLEIGSSDSGLRHFLESRFEGVEYRSMDVDRQTTQDYYSLDEIDEKFDAILFFEVIEHMPFAEGMPMLGRIYDLLKPAGLLIMTTPNVAHPTHYYRDPTHVTPYSHEGLGGMLVSLGFEVKGMYRIYNAPFIQKVFRMYIAALVHRYIGVDFTHSLLVVARRRARDRPGTRE